MSQYSDYQDILNPLNFVGGAGQSSLPNTNNDDRAEVLAEGTGIYQFPYKLDSCFFQCFGKDIQKRI